MESVIKWQTGEPNIIGAFLVAYKKSVCKFERKRGFWMYCGLIINDKDVVAWCKLSDIKPYKEETKWKQIITQESFRNMRERRSL